MDTIRFEHEADDSFYRVVKQRVNDELAAARRVAEPSKTLQDWRDGNVERTSRSGIQVDRRPEHLIRPTIDADGILRGELVEPGDIAVRLVKTHQPMDLRDSIECSIDARIQIRLARA